MRSSLIFSEMQLWYQRWFSLSNCHWLPAVAAKTTTCLSCSSFTLPTSLNPAPQSLISFSPSQHHGFRDRDMTNGNFVVFHSTILTTGYHNYIKNEIFFGSTQIEIQNIYIFCQWLLLYQFFEFRSSMRTPHSTSSWAGVLRFYCCVYYTRLLYAELSAASLTNSL